MHQKLAAVALGAADPRGERARRGTGEGRREGGCERRLLEQRPSPIREVDRDRRCERRAVHEREPLLQSRFVRLGATGCERIARRYPLAVLEHESLPDERLEEVRERDHFSRGSVGTDRNVRRPAVVQPLR